MANCPSSDTLRARPAERYPPTDGRADAEVDSGGVRAAGRRGDPRAGGPDRAAWRRNDLQGATVQSPRHEHPPSRARPHPGLRARLARAVADAGGARPNLAPSQPRHHRRDPDSDAYRDASTRAGPGRNRQPFGPRTTCNRAGFGVRSSPASWARTSTVYSVTGVSFATRRRSSRSAAGPIGALRFSQRETVSGVVPMRLAKSTPDQPRDF